MEGSTLRTLNIVTKLCGEANLKNVVLVTTFWNDIDEKLGERRERELLECDSFWKTLVEQGSKVERMSRDYESFKAVLIEMAKGPVMKLQIQQEMQEGKPIEETLAGLFINEEYPFEMVSDGEPSEQDEWWSDYFLKTKRESEEADRRKKQRDAELARIERREEEEAARLQASCKGTLEAAFLEFVKDPWTHRNCPSTWRNSQSRIIHWDTFWILGNSRIKC